MDRDTLRQQLDALHADSFGWALACCRHDRMDAEDVLQTVYLRVLEGRTSFDGRSPFKTWLFGMIRLTAAGERRRGLFRRALLDRNSAVFTERASTTGPELHAEHAERATRLRSALGGLAARQREVLHLVFYNELSIEEAAAVLGVSVGTARTHYDRGKKRLAVLLNGDLR